MVNSGQKSLTKGWITPIVLFCVCASAWPQSPTIIPSPYWKNRIAVPDESFASFPAAGLRWIKFTVLAAPYDPNLVYFQHTKKYPLHHQFAAAELDPFQGMSAQQYYQAVLGVDDPPAVLGTVLLPPADVNEYAIQFVQYDREKIRDCFFLVMDSVDSPPGARVLLFPTFEQQAQAEADRDWFASYGISIGSSSRWAQGNTCYAEGWALGTLKYVPGDQIVDTYQSSQLTVADILLTDGVPAEIPALAGVITLNPSTPNSHVAILSRTYATPFVHLAVMSDAEQAQNLVGQQILLSAYEDASGVCETQLIGIEGVLDETMKTTLLSLKELPPLNIQPMTAFGGYGVPTDNLLPEDTRFFGGKAAHFGILRQSIPDNSPRAMALSFDIWQTFLDQPISTTTALSLAPGDYLIVWADDDQEQGPTHTSFKLSRKGESLSLIDRDGLTVLDTIHFGAQMPDVSYGRSLDGGDNWGFQTHPTPGSANTNQPGSLTTGLVINEIMANNESTLADPCEPGEYPDWIELYNGSDHPIQLNGLYLTDDPAESTKWQFPVYISGGTLRDEITHRLSAHQSYPPADIQALWEELAAIRNLFRESDRIQFPLDLRTDLLTLLTDDQIGYDPQVKLRFRSSTNVEDSQDYTGAGLYDSFSGCPADDLDNDDLGPSHCDPNRPSERGVVRAMRRTMASFYNDNAYLERLRRKVPEANVGMAMVVHPSFPDEIELANGVATVKSNPWDDTSHCTLVTQWGATSVTNPVDGSTPEEVLIVAKANRTLQVHNSQGRLTRLNVKSPNGIKNYSSLKTLGDTVMNWTDDYSQLVNLLLDVSDRFAEVTGQSAYTLDLEYKKVAPGDQTLPNGGLVVKQVRQVPEPNEADKITPFLIGIPAEYEVFSGEFDEDKAYIDVFADHRLKSQWQLTPKSMALDANDISEGLYDTVIIKSIDNQNGLTQQSIESQERSFQGQTASDSWIQGESNNPRTYSLLTTQIPTQISAGEKPFFTLQDFGTPAYTPTRVLTLKATYENPVRSLQSIGLTTTQENVVHLWPRPTAHPKDILQERSVQNNGISVHSSFYFPAPESFGLATWGLNSTAPLQRWDRTVIEGLSDDPIVLTGYYSQTYRPEHHNLTEHFLFEPGLEPSLPQAVLADLQDRNIRLIHLIINHDGFSGKKATIQTYN